MDIQHIVSAHWFETLRDIKSLGETVGRPGSLGGLAAARRVGFSPPFP